MSKRELPLSLLCAILSLVFGMVGIIVLVGGYHLYYLQRNILTSEFSEHLVALPALEEGYDSLPSISINTRAAANGRQRTLEAVPKSHPIPYPSPFCNTSS
jgi:hypothetical protein